MTESRMDLLHQLLRFAASTGFSAALSFGLPVALVEIGGLGHSRAVQIGFVAAYLANLLLLRGFVYRSQNQWRRDVTRFVVVNAAFRLAEYAAFEVLTRATALGYALVLGGVLAISAGIKFFAYRRVFAG